jgi:hypothetical protein
MSRYFPPPPFIDSGASSKVDDWTNIHSLALSMGGHSSANANTLVASTALAPSSSSSFNLLSSDLSLLQSISDDNQSDLLNLSLPADPPHHMGTTEWNLLINDSHACGKLHASLKKQRKQRAKKKAPSKALETTTAARPQFMLDPPGPLREQFSIQRGAGAGNRKQRNDQRRTVSTRSDSDFSSHLFTFSLREPQSISILTSPGSESRRLVRSGRGGSNQPRTLSAEGQELLVESKNIFFALQIVNGLFSSSLDDADRVIRNRAADSMTLTSSRAGITIPLGEAEEIIRKVRSFMSALVIV